MSLPINKLFLTLAVLYITLFSIKAVFLGKTVYGDGIYYYSWARSIIVDRDISFENEYNILGGTQPKTSKEKAGNVYPIGPPLFWSPFFVVVHSIVQGDGFTFAYQFFIGFISCLYTLSGLVILFRLLLKYFSEEISFLCIIGIAFGTNLLFYGALDTVNSHSVSFFVSTILLTFILEKRSLFAIGILTGMLALIRTQDAIFVLLAIPLFIKRFSSVFIFLFSFFLAFLPQLFAWQVLYGTFLKSSYFDPYHYFDFVNPHLIEVLLSPNNGLFFWTPLVALCVLGLVLQKRKLFILLFLIQWYLIASWSFWWQGASFSGRMFISLLPLFAFGLAKILSGMYPWTRISVITTSCVINVGVIFFYLITH